MGGTPMRIRRLRFSVAAFTFAGLLLGFLTYGQLLRESAALQDSSNNPPKVNFTDIAALAGLTSKTVAGGEQ